jgi:outer membrane autotransporter protein
MKNKIILGLTLATPLAVNALELQGTQTYTDKINVPITHDLNKVNGEITSGISIFANSNTVFEKNVTINIQREANRTEDGASISGIDNVFLHNSVSSSTIFNGDLTIHMQGHDSDAISLLGNSTVIVNGKTTLSVSDREWSDAIFISDGNLTLNGESVIDGNIISIENGVLKINNKSIINGDIDASLGGTIILDLASGSKIVGRVSGFGDPDEGDPDTTGIIKMNLAKGASWQITDEDSYLTELSGQGSIKFVNDNSNGNYGELTIENLKGESSFDLRTNITAEKSDKIIISKSADTNRPISAEGTHTLNLTNNGASNTTGKEKLTLVEIDDNATSTAEFKTNHNVELGGYQYSLNKEGNNYVLTANPITSSAMASVGFLNSNYLMSYVETQTLLKRLGDMRTSGQFGDVWLRGFSGKLDSFSGGKLSKFDMSYHGFQFGADKQLSEDSPFVVGAFVGQTYGDPDYRKGDGSLKSFNTGLYATYLNNDGFYVDGVAKYARQKNHFKVKDTANNHVQGTGHTNGLGLSLELGQKFKLNDFYIEPQSQLSYSHQNATSINATNGLKVKLGNYNSLIGRASALFGYEINSVNNNINIYAKTGIVREFNGDTYYKLNTSKEKHSFKGNWWNNGVGITAQFNQQHNIYLDLESSPGSRFDLLQVNGGYRFSF